MWRLSLGYTSKLDANVQINPAEDGFAGHVMPFVMSLRVDMNLSADYDEKAEYQKYLERIRIVDCTECSLIDSYERKQIDL